MLTRMKQYFKSKTKIFEQVLLSKERQIDDLRDACFSAEITQRYFADMLDKEKRKNARLKAENANLKYQCQRLDKSLYKSKKRERRGNKYVY